MSIDTSTNNKRIAKNTLLLYIRSFFVMVVSLYTSRVVLQTLGVDDYGIYNVVGGVVAMFSIISSSLSSAISRFITFELGRGNTEKLQTIFSISINIQLAISLLVLLLGGTIGGWFLNTYMNIAQERIVAANWVLFCSLLVFCVNLVSVPYNACIIAHERMSAFAYIGILEVLLKLGVCYLIIISPFDNLISYAVLLLVVSVIIRIIYGVYCNSHFKECHYKFVKDKSQLKSMTIFASWNFITNGCFILNTQGINILINLFFGVTFNAARGIATQVDGAIMQFVNNFTVAISPQITKSYASGEKEEMFRLVCRGVKFSYFLLLIFALPVIFESDYILSLWLEIVPERTSIFLRLTIIGTMINLLGNTGFTACQATGNIKKYVIWVSSVGCLVFPLTWIAFKMGLSVETTYIIYILVYILVNTIRLYIMKGLLDFPPMLFVRDVLSKIFIVTIIAIVPPLVAKYYIEQSFFKLVLMTIISILSSLTTIYLLGLTHNERVFVRNKMISVRDRFIYKR